MSDSTDIGSPEQRAAVKREFTHTLITRYDVAGVYGEIHRDEFTFLNPGLGSTWDDELELGERVVEALLPENRFPLLMGYLQG